MKTYHILFCCLICLAVCGCKAANSTSSKSLWYALEFSYSTKPAKNPKATYTSAKKIIRQRLRRLSVQAFRVWQGKQTLRVCVPASAFSSKTVWPPQPSLLTRWWRRMFGGKGLWPPPPPTLTTFKQYILARGQLQFRILEDGSMDAKAIFVKLSRTAPKGFTRSTSSYASPTGHAPDRFFMSARRAPLASWLQRENTWLQRDYQSKYRLMLMRYQTTGSSLWRTALVRNKVWIDNQHLAAVKLQHNPYDNTPAVALEMTSAGARRFATATAKHVGRRLGMIVDDEIYLAPVIQMKIAGGRALLTMGHGTGSKRKLYREAYRIAHILQTNALPATLQLRTQKLLTSPQARKFGCQ